jgi:hypothetical protein
VKLLWKIKGLPLLELFRDENGIYGIKIGFEIFFDVF